MPARARLVLAGLASLAYLAGSHWLMVAAADAAWSGFALLFLAQHVAIHLGLAALFGFSLRAGSLALISRVALRVHGTLTPAMARYTRQVTLAWTLYFIAIALASVGLFEFASFDTWATFANWGTPLALGAMFGAEHLLRYQLHPEFERVSIWRAIRAYSQRATRGAVP